MKSDVEGIQKMLEQNQAVTVMEVVRALPVVPGIPSIVCLAPFFLPERTLDNWN